MIFEMNVNQVVYFWLKLALIGVRITGPIRRNFWGFISLFSPFWTSDRSKHVFLFSFSAPGINNNNNTDIYIACLT